MSDKILIIDDDTDLVEAVSTLLEANNYTVLQAHTADEGYDTALKENPDLILLDVMISTKTDGIELAKKLDADEKIKNIPVIMITGIRRDLNLPFGLEPDPNFLPVEAFLEKPIKPDVLLNNITALLKK